jgi:hypothetical protein
LKICAMASDDRIGISRWHAPDKSPDLPIEAVC